MSRQPTPHRKRVRHYHDPDHCHELMCSCYHRLPLLTNHLWRSLLSECIDRANERHDYHLAAFVYMPEHIHLLVFPGPNALTIDKLLKSFKRPFSFRIKRLLHQTNSPLLRRLTVHQRPGVETFRFWQEGPGYDRNLDRVDTVLAAIEYTTAILSGAAWWIGQSTGSGRVHVGTKTCPTIQTFDFQSLKGYRPSF